MCLDDFRKVSKAVAGVELNDHLIDLVFVIFDENGMSLNYSNMWIHIPHVCLQNPLYVLAEEATQNPLVLLY